MLGPRDEKKRVTAPFEGDEMTWQDKACVFLRFYHLLDTTVVKIYRYVVIKRKGGGKMTGLEQIIFYDRT